MTLYHQQAYTLQCKMNIAFQTKFYHPDLQSVATGDSLHSGEDSFLFFARYFLCGHLMHMINRSFYEAQLKSCLLGV